MRENVEIVKRHVRNVEKPDCGAPRGNTNFALFPTVLFSECSPDHLRREFPRRRHLDTGFSEASVRAPEFRLPYHNTPFNVIYDHRPVNSVSIVAQIAL